ncbi:MAG: LarC family nickel insertion protein [Synechococcus sp.]|nr:LarC family nickel insertion protein [Synechococcus sp.]
MAPNWAYCDAPTGVAGDMLLAALLDQGLPPEVVREPLEAIGFAQAFALKQEQARSAGLRGLRLTVELKEHDPPPRHWRELRPLLQQAPWPEALRTKVLQVFSLLASAEGAVHGMPAEQVHFHEVGAVDALVDVVGVCAGLLHFGVERLIASPPPAGHGRVRTAHGLLPLPAPAVLEIARAHAIPLASSEGFPAAELTTPTGLALLAAWVDHWGPPPAHTPAAVGVGLGHRQLDRPNLLRLWRPAPSAEAGAACAESLLQQQCQIDDMDAEALAFLQEQLRQAGALEVFAQPAQMKKGRTGVLLTCLAHPEQGDALRRIWWRHSSSLGLRETLQRRWRLPRCCGTLQTAWGPVRAKVADTGEGLRCKPEADELARLALEHQLSWAELRAALAALPPEAWQPDPNPTP